MEASCAQILGLIMLVNTNLAIIIAFATPYWVLFTLGLKNIGLWAECAGEHCTWVFDNDFELQDHQYGIPACYFSSYSNIFIYTSLLVDLTLTMPNFLNGIIHLHFLALSIIILGILRWKLVVGQPTV